MAIVAFAETLSNYGVKIFKWTGLGNLDTGAPLPIPSKSDKTVQVYGTFGSGGSVTIQGSNDLATETPTYASLHKIDISALTYTSAGIDTVVDNPNLIRPSVTAGDGDTDLDVIICVK